MGRRTGYLQAIVCIVILSVALTPAVHAQKSGCGCAAIPTRENAKIPKAVRTYLAANLPGYEAVGEGDYDEAWLENPDVHWALAADFDGNRRLDYALLMKNQDTIALVVVLRQNSGYAHTILEKDLCDVPVIATLGIQQKGHTNLAEPDAPANMKYFWNPAIRLGILEPSIELHWYWEEGEWHTV
ncbi:MAG: hypothetical protein AMXMBFR82_42240 [Candidatus Hydrogenedentota bacterium]